VPPAGLSLSGRRCEWKRASASLRGAHRRARRLPRVAGLHGDASRQTYDGASPVHDAHDLAALDLSRLTAHDRALGIERSANTPLEADPVARMKRVRVTAHLGLLRHARDEGPGG